MGIDFGYGIWNEKGFGDMNVLTHVKLIVILLIYAIVYIIELSDNFSIMWY